MFLFLVEHWKEEYKGHVFQALYAVRARNINDCARVLFEFSDTETEDNLEQKYDLIKEQVVVSKKIWLFHKYSKSVVVEDMQNRD